MFKEKNTEAGAEPRTLIRQSGVTLPPEACLPTKAFDQHQFGTNLVHLVVHCGAFVGGYGYRADVITSECGDCYVRTAPVFQELERCADRRFLNEVDAMEGWLEGPA